MDRRKALVRDCYDAVADVWAGKRRAMGTDARERSFRDRFFAAIPDGGRVLDLGCGGGEILEEVCGRGAKPIGVDFSRRLLEKARARCPTAILLEADLSEIAFAPAAFAAIVSYDAIWNVPRDEHGALFARLREWLATGGPALLTVGAVEDPGAGLYTTLEGAPTFYDAWPQATTFDLLGAAGFAVIDHGLRDRHLIIFARAT